MFDELIRELRRLEAPRSIPVSIAVDAEGYLDRRCPSDQCGFEFKVHVDDWRDRVGDDEVFCPFCRHTDRSGEWCTPSQLEFLQKAAERYIQQRIAPAMTRDALAWNRRQPSGGFIRMNMRVEVPAQPRPRLPEAAELMRLRISCPACSCRYAVIGAAFFCPACGHNSAELVFGQSLNGIRKILDSLDTIRGALADRDAAEMTARLVTEAALLATVTAFQRYAEALYVRQPSVETPRRNAFQNLHEGSDLWLASFGKRYRDHLNEAELFTLNRAFQQRHLLAHTQGVVDQGYVDRSGDTNYRVGQRLVIRPTHVRAVLDLAERLAASLAHDVACIAPGFLGTTAP